MEQKNYQPIQPAVYMPETDAFTNAINQLSAVNGALAQENRTLTQRLGQVEDKTYQQITAAYQKAWLQEVTRYEDISFFVDQSSKKPMVCLQNRVGYYTAKKLSDCCDFSVEYGFDPVLEERTICVTFCTGMQKSRSFTIPERDYQAAALYDRFLACGGSVCYGKQSGVCAGMFFRFISSLLAQAPAEVSVPGWQRLHDRWTFQPGDGTEWAEPLLCCSALEHSGQAVYTLARVYGALKGRLPQEICLSRPICLVGSACPQAALSLNDPPKEFARGLKQGKYQPWVFVGPEAVSNYRSQTNMARLVTQASSGASTVYFVCTRALSPLQRDHCLVIEMDERPSGEPFHQARLSDLMNQVEKNPDVFDNMVGKAYRSALDAVDEDSRVRQDLIALRVAAAVVDWYFANTIATEQETNIVAEKLQSALGEALTQWVGVNSPDILQRFRSVLYAAKREQKFRVELLQGASEDACRTPCVFCDDSYYYIPFRLLKQIIAEYLPDFQPSCLFLALKEAGVLGEPVKRYLTTESGYRKEMRFRTLSRAKLRIPGQRELMSV